LRYASSADERFFGFGEQLTYFDSWRRIVHSEAAVSSAA
jgi:hypothetical protein